MAATAASTRRPSRTSTASMFPPRAGGGGLRDRTRMPRRASGGKKGDRPRAPVRLAPARGQWPRPAPSRARVLSSDRVERPPAPPLRRARRGAAPHPPPQGHQLAPQGPPAVLPPGRARAAPPRVPAAGLRPGGQDPGAQEPAAADAGAQPGGGALTPEVRRVRAIGAAPRRPGDPALPRALAPPLRRPARPLPGHAGGQPGPRPAVGLAAESHRRGAEALGGPGGAG